MASASWSATRFCPEDREVLVVGAGGPLGQGAHAGQDGDTDDQVIPSRAPGLDVGGGVQPGPPVGLVEIVGGKRGKGAGLQAEGGDTEGIGFPGVDPEGNVLGEAGAQARRRGGALPARRRSCATVGERAGLRHLDGDRRALRTGDEGDGGEEDDERAEDGPCPPDPVDGSRHSRHRRGSGWPLPDDPTDPNLAGRIHPTREAALVDQGADPPPSSPHRPSAWVRCA